MIDPKNIQLTENELNKCLEFSEISAQNQQKIEFGQKTTSPRKVSEIARDNLIGKNPDLHTAPSNQVFKPN